MLTRRCFDIRVSMFTLSHSLVVLFRPPSGPAKECTFSTTQFKPTCLYRGVFNSGRKLQSLCLHCCFKSTTLAWKFFSLQLKQCLCLSAMHNYILLYFDHLFGTSEFQSYIYTRLHKILNCMHQFWPELKAWLAKCSKQLEVYPARNTLAHSAWPHMHTYLELQLLHIKQL